MLFGSQLLLVKTYLKFLGIFSTEALLTYNDYTF